MSFIYGMIKSLKENRLLLKSRRDSYNSDYINGIHSKEKGEPLTFKEVSNQELARINDRNRKRIKREEKKLIWISSISVILLIVLLVYSLK